MFCLLLTLVGYLLFSKEDHAQSTDSPELQECLNAIITQQEKVLAPLQNEQYVQSSVDTFLEDLNQRTGEQSHSAATQENFPTYQIATRWTANQTLETSATEVLRSYQACESAMLMTSGYLDLKGLVWGAIVLCPQQWVDVVLVSSDTTDIQSTTTVSRTGVQDAA